MARCTILTRPLSVATSAQVQGFLKGSASSARSGEPSTSILSASSAAFEAATAGSSWPISSAVSLAATAASLTDAGVASGVVGSSSSLAPGDPSTIIRSEFSDAFSASTLGSPPAFSATFSAANAASFSASSTYLPSTGSEPNARREDDCEKRKRRGAMHWMKERNGRSARKKTTRAYATRAGLAGDGTTCRRGGVEAAAHRRSERSSP